MKRHQFTDEQWALVESLAPPGRARTGRPSTTFGYISGVQDVPARDEGQVIAALELLAPADFKAFIERIEERRGGAVRAAFRRHQSSRY